LAFVRLLGGAARWTLDMLLPPNCVTCDLPVIDPGQLCPACFSRIGFISDPSCSRCGVPFSMTAEGGRDLVCPACEARSPVFDQARGAMRYDDASRKLILAFKHADRTELAGALAPHMVRAGAPLLVRADVLVPVPLHRRRLFQRRYNQAALLARAIGRIARLPAVMDAMARTRATASLGEKSAKDRAAEVGGAFAVRRSRIGKISGARVLLIDDVMTSGATANECARALYSAGALAVDVLVAARVPDPRLR
jgi:ComF family protein